MTNETATERRSPRRTPRGDLRRAAILSAAMRLFGERGYDAASMAAIAAEAGTAKSVIYDHFPSKTELHRALVEQEADALLAHVAQHVPPPTEASYEQRLRAGIDAFFAYIEHHRASWRLLMRDAPAEPALAGTYARIQAQASSAIAWLVAPDPPADAAKREHKQMLAELLKSSISGMADWWYDHPDVPRERVVRAVVEFAWLGLRSEAGG